MPNALSLSVRNKIDINDFPYLWVPLVNFFEPELPGFPLTRFHFIENETRVFGVPTTYSVDRINDDGTCNLSVEVLSNKEFSLNTNAHLYRIISDEIRERLGLSQALTIDDIKECCGDNKDWKTIIDLIFPRLKKYYGVKIPCGQFYPKLYGIFRFIGAWNTPGGGKQEKIMLSNLLSRVGTKVKNKFGWEGLNFYLLPTYDEVITNNFKDFKNFIKLYDAIMNYGDTHLQNTYTVQGKRFYILDADKNVPGGKGAEEKWDSLLSPLNHDTCALLNGIKEDFNRNFQRPFVFITYLYNLFKGVDFDQWDENDYAIIIRENPRGLYPKVMGCFLQQSFSKYGCIPVDTWVQSFFEEVFLTDAKDIPTSGNNLGKFERFIWYTVQLRKTNQEFFENILFCIKTGVLHSKQISNRKANPLSCSLCSIHDNCPIFNKISGDTCIILNNSSVQETKEENNFIELKVPKLTTECDIDRYFNPNILQMGQLQTAEFIILLNENGRPHGVYTPKNRQHTKWLLTDNMSSFTITNSFMEGVYKVSGLLFA